MPMIDTDTADVQVQGPAVAPAARLAPVNALAADDAGVPHEGDSDTDTATFGGESADTLMARGRDATLSRKKYRCLRAARLLVNAVISSSNACFMQGQRNKVDVALDAAHKAKEAVAALVEQMELLVRIADRREALRPLAWPDGTPEDEDMPASPAPDAHRLPAEGGQ